MEHILKILSVTPVTHNVRCIRFAKPEGYTFRPGQATDVAINKEGWREEKRPFTFTCLNEDPYLEFTIKCYEDHDGVTAQVAQLREGDELIIEDPWGAIEYQGEGYFIAGGAGITPFMAILRQLHKEGLLKNNKLFFSNKTAADIIYEEELKNMLGNRVIFLLTDVDDNLHPYGYIDKEFIEMYMAHIRSKPFYICGPDPMVNKLSGMLIDKGADPHAVVFEK